MQRLTLHSSQKEGCSIYKETVFIVFVEASKHLRHFKRYVATLIKHKLEKIHEFLACVPAALRNS